MVRTRTFDPATALTKAMDLFSSKGYSETSMEDIVRATGVSRYGIYGTFGNKRELFEQALDRYADAMGKDQFLYLMTPDATFAHIRQIFDDRVTEMCCSEETKGCLFVHTAMELAPENDEIRDVLLKLMKQMSRAFTIGLETAKRKGEVREDVDSRAAGDMLTGTMFGLTVLARTGFKRARLDAVVDSMLAPLAA